ncbi:ScbR family autoregulator-binding transcription factor [Streptomyces brasiliensis]|uniref:Gamma-butyrolactone-binding protein n=1 Tax=Streptomyces brasiliensis TaxID=1954 RepID=A0A917L4I9_9ACTN|nr:ScbR family autoregulator-binding transcription factor [Streptomyces brasiliensis]GGJ44487.1 gamma-butyrolactone-binding protein [Streptomyces brasiliensis]
MAQQERAIRTRHAILKAAASVFDERGYEAATIGEILARAGVTKGALYFHFPSKQALAEGVFTEQFTVLALPPRTCKLQELVDVGLLTAYRMRRDPLVSGAARLSLEGEMGMQLGPQLIGGWIGATEKLLTEAKAQGELLPHVDPAESAWIFSAAWTGVQVYSHNTARRSDLEERIAQLFTHLLPSVAVPAVLGRLLISAGRAREVGEESERFTRETAAAEEDAVPAAG